MANNIRPGCAKTPGNRYLPIVFEAHGRVFFAGKSYSGAAEAVTHAEDAIHDLTYQYWHNHALGDSHNA